MYSTYDKETGEIETLSDPLNAAIQEWLKQFGVCMVSVTYACDNLEVVLAQVASNRTDGLYHLLGGTSALGTDHIVVCKDGVIVHDPSPVESGIHGPESNGYFWIMHFCRAIL